MDNKTNVSWVQISLLLWLKHHPNFKWKAHKEVWQNSRALQSTAEKDTPANLNGRLNMNESMVAFLSLFIDSLSSIKRTVSNDRNQKIFFVFWRTVLVTPCQFTRFFPFPVILVKTQSLIHDLMIWRFSFEFFWRQGNSKKHFYFDNVCHALRIMNINLDGGGTANTAFDATNAAKIMLNSHLISATNRA